jgi:hypothetical protein
MCLPLKPCPKSFLPAFEAALSLRFLMFLVRSRYSSANRSNSISAPRSSPCARVLPPYGMLCTVLIFPASSIIPGAVSKKLEFALLTAAALEVPAYCCKQYPCESQMEFRCIGLLSLCSSDDLMGSSHHIYCEHNSITTRKCCDDRT